MMCIIFLCICGCKSDHYVLVIYEREPVEIELQQKKVEDFHQFINTIMNNSKKAKINKNDMPKSFSYIIKNNNQEEYLFTSGYLLHNKDCYIVDDYQNIINKLKVIFTGEDSKS